MDEQSTPKPRIKSFRKKYNKIRYQFKAKYEENTSLHEEEQRLIKISKRLQETNDQLLDMLADVNGTQRIPEYLSYQLDTAPEEADLPALDIDLETKRSSAEKMLEQAQQGLLTGQWLRHDYNILEAELKGSLRRSMKAQSLARLEKTISHTSADLLKVNEYPTDIVDTEFNTYLDATHEDTYLALLDANIDGLPTATDTPTGKPILSEATMKNPVSIYNWLREHKPDVFVQEPGTEKEKAEEKESKPAAPTPAAIKRESRTVKRTSALEMLDDEGNLLGPYQEPTPSSSKSKRKRDDDAYKPKGGGGAAKRRKKSTAAKAVDAE